MNTVNRSERSSLRSLLVFISESSIGHHNCCSSRQREDQWGSEAHLSAPWPHTTHSPLSHTAQRAVISPLKRRGLVRRQFKWHVHLCSFNEEIRGGDGRIGAERGTGLASGRSFGCWLWKPRGGGWEGGREGKSKHLPPSASKVMRSFVQETERILDERRTPTGCLRGTPQFL